MKKIVQIFVIALLPMGLFAQGPISFGPKIGWNTTQLSTDYHDYVNQLKNGFQGGLFFSIYMDKIYVQPEVYFSLKRGLLDTTIGDPSDPYGSLNVSQSISLTTIDIPMLLGYKLLDLKLARLRVWGGPVASYVINKSYELSLNGLDNSEMITKEDFKDATWGFQLGAGVDLLFLTFDVGYEFGLENFMRVSSLDDFSLKNNLFYCSIGWRLF
ncbi:MAG: PorT family protein [Bacteroidetes bacterium]|jgi:hypothetical protein|nr:PorT family protein [Bacteroidota bacterium]MBT3748754.1 PorT family protein [Bacteroidota bacterium]MBT4399123.1 PorT family protein [Bacteroidota bacterium]MBT4410620.1 PorT family protein [Bacteroidota bacterium]MBT5425335.1 PorT family protein [Bacteroidota bacterium]